MSSPEKWVGRSVERFEDEALLTGRARFIDDLEPASVTPPSCAAPTAAPIF
jgi:CO/xanthine dehydrogenase Mo-binding subunit